MRILPISNNNICTQKKQNNPNFGARINKSLLKQMLSKTAPLNNLEVMTTAGVLTMPAIAAVKMNLKSETTPNELDINSLSSTDLYNMCMEQDEEGKTFIHKLSLTSALIKVLNEKLTPEQFEKVFTVKDKHGKGPLQPYLTDESGVVEDLMKTINNSTLSLEAALNIACVNGLSTEYPNLIKFWQHRLRKQIQMQSQVSIHINNSLYNDLQKGQYLNVETVNEVFEGVDAQTVAKLFKTDSTDPEWAEIDSEYLPYATKEEIENLTASAQGGSQDALKELCNAILKITPVEKQKPVIKKMLESVYIGKFLSREHTDVIRAKLGNNAFEKLHRKKDSDGHTIIGNSVYKTNNGIIIGSDFEYHFNELKKVDSDLLEKVILTKNVYGQLDITSQDGVMNFILDEYKDRPDIIKKIYMNQDNEGDTYLHYADDKNIAKALELLNDEDLAEILSIKNNNGRTPMKAQIIECDNNQLFDKIIELATDSDLSIDKSISLLEANNMESQVVEFLKLQKSLQQPSDVSEKPNLN